MGPTFMVTALAVGSVLGACTGEEAIPIDPANPPSLGGSSVDPTSETPGPTGITHPLEPTDQMREAARQQCRDDPSLAEGYVKAVDPRTDAILVEFSIPCDQVR